IMGRIIAFQSWRNKSTTMATRTTASRSVWKTSSTDWDEGRRVVNDPVIDAFGKLLFQLRHLLLDGVGDVERVGAGQLEDGQADRGQAVEPGDLVVLLGAHLDAGDVAEADDGGGRRALLVAAALEDDVLELLDVPQPPQRAHGQLELLPGGDGLLADLP